MSTPATITASPAGFLDTAAVSARFFGNRSAQTIRKYVNEGGLPCHRVGRRIYYDPVEVDAWVRRQSAPATSGDAHRQAIKRLVDAAPELTADQAAKIRAVLSGGAA